MPWNNAVSFLIFLIIAFFAITRSIDIMNQGKYLFVTMTVLFALPLTAVGSVLTSESINWPHRVLQLTYILPATVLMTDMFFRYSSFHENGRFRYNGWEITLDVLLLVFLYAALTQLGKPPDKSDDRIFFSYPSQDFWGWLIAYSVLKLVRIRRMILPNTSTGISWYVVLHCVLFLAIVGGWYWQRLLGGGNPHRLPSFVWSGVLFMAATTIYMVFVHACRWNPLSRCGLL